MAEIDMGLYEALTRGAGVVDLGSRTQIELTGPDRVTYLHNLCTNDLRKLAVGNGCEAFLTNVQGKVLAHIHIWAHPDSLLVETVGKQGDRLMKHLDRYLIRERVELFDRSNAWGELLVAGAAADNVLAKLAEQPWLPRPVAITQQPCYLLSMPVESRSAASEALLAAGAVACSTNALEQVRVEAGFPWYGSDITEENLAPEVGRDRQAISYTKGCYLGQETIARIDALGHVNRLLTRVAFTGPDLPSVGSELLSGDKVVGQITSVVYSPQLQAPLGLAYVRRGHNDPGTQLQSAFGPGTVLARTPS